MSDRRATLGDGARMQRCYELAEAAVADGDHPFGALLVVGDEVVAEARNEVNTGSDVTRHAERLLVSRAWGRIDPGKLRQATLYASTEPCIMCAGSIHWAGVRRVVFGVPGAALAAVVGKPYDGIPLERIAATAGWDLEILGPVMEDDGLRIHREFWPRQDPAA